MRYIGIIILLVLCLTLLLFTGCMNNAVEPGTVYPQQWATGDGTVSNPWANDCIQKAYDAVPVGGTIFLRAGYYQLAGELVISKTINIIGEGMGKTIVRTAEGTADKAGFDIYYAEYVSMRNLTIDGDAQIPGTDNQRVLAVDYSDYITLENVEAMNGGWYGINIYQENHSSFQNLYSHDNYRHGVHPGSDTTGRNRYNTYRDIYAWNNGVGGFDDIGMNALPAEDSYNIYDNLQCWDNGSHGIVIAAQNKIILSNSTTRGNGAPEEWTFGIYLIDVEDSTISNCSAISNNVMGIGIISSNNININDCFSILNVGAGMHLESSVGLNLTNVIVKNNSTGMVLSLTDNTSEDYTMTSCQFYDDRETPLQNWGLEFTATGTMTGLTLLNCKLSPNEYGEMYNPAGVVVTVIPEKRKHCKW